MSNKKLFSYCRACFLSPKDTKLVDLLEKDGENAKKFQKISGIDSSAFNNKFDVLICENCLEVVVKAFEIITKSKNLERFYFSVWREKLEAKTAMEKSEDDEEFKNEIVKEVQETLASFSLKQEELKESKTVLKNPRNQPMMKTVIEQVKESKKPTVESNNKATHSFACDKCPKEFSTQTGLRFHVKFHDFPLIPDNFLRAPTNFEGGRVKTETDEDLDDRAKTEFREPLKWMQNAENFSGMLKVKEEPYQHECRSVKEEIIDDFKLENNRRINPEIHQRSTGCKQNDHSSSRQS